MSLLAHALGWKAVHTLTELVGGQSLRIPSMANDPASVGARARLVRLVGTAMAEDLITHFARCRLYIPRGPSPHNSKANPIDCRKVARMTGRGMTAKTIAGKLNCTERTVYLKRAEFLRITGKVNP